MVTSLMTQALVSLLIVLVIVCAFFYPTTAVRWVSSLTKWMNCRESLVLCAILLTQFLLTVSIAIFSLHVFPWSADEYAYLFQAKTFALGRLSNPAPPDPERFAIWRILIKDGIWVSQYPPGWPLILFIALSIGFPLWLVNPVLGTVSVFLTYCVAARLFSKGTALLAASIFAFSPFYLFNAASFFSHTSCALMILAGVYFSLNLEARQSSFLCGFFAACGFATRYYTAMLAFLPGAISALVGLCRSLRKSERNLALYRQAMVFIGLGACAPLALNFYYNFCVTGDPIIDPQSWYYGRGRLAGFMTMRDFGGSLSRAASLLMKYLSWAPAGAVLLFPLSLVYLRSQGRLHWCLTTPLFLVAGYLFFPSNGVLQHGPRYYYEAFPFVSISFAASCSLLYNSVREKRVAILIAAAVAASVAISLSSLPTIADRSSGNALERISVFSRISEAGVRDAVVFFTKIDGVELRDMLRNDPDLSNDPIYVDGSRGIDCSLLPRLRRSAAFVAEFADGQQVSLKRVCD